MMRIRGRVRGALKMAELVAARVRCRLRGERLAGRALWALHPWELARIGRHRLTEPTALLTVEERRLFYWLAAGNYRGTGEIIDAGAFLGGSARCFAAGLSDNPAVTDKRGRIHSYDLFRVTPVYAHKEDLQGRAMGDSTLDIFHKTVGPAFQDFVEVYPGDLLQRDWDGRPIEILMLDVCKTQALNDHCLRIFFPALQVGSIVVQQDFKAKSRLWWIHLTMHLLRDHFAYLGAVQRGGSAAFEVVKEIDRSDAEAVVERLAGLDQSQFDALVADAAAALGRYDQRFSRALLDSAQAFAPSFPPLD